MTVVAVAALVLVPSVVVPERAYADEIETGPAAETETVELVNLSEEPELDRQRIAVGMSAGAGFATTRGSGTGVPLADFSVVGAFGLGPGGARVPWTIEASIAFAITSATVLQSAVRKHPNRFTEFGGRLVYRGQDGLLAHRWVSLGTGIVFTSWGDEQSNNGNISPGVLAEVGLGLVEGVSSRARYGIGVRVPVEISAHSGLAVIGFFYAQLGLGK